VVGHLNGANIGKRTSVADNQHNLKARMANFFFGAEVCFFAWMIVGWPLWNLVRLYL
jgi:hypothetical protein